MPAVHVSVGTAISTALVNVGVVVGVGCVTSWWIGGTFGEDEDPESTNEEKERKWKWNGRLDIGDIEYSEVKKRNSIINIGILGAPGSGKSSLVNALLGLGPGDDGAAPVGATEATTTSPRQYTLYVEGDDFECSLEAKTDNPVTVCLWDLPAIGSKRYPDGATVDNMSLASLDVVWIVYSRRVGLVEIELAKRLENILKVPHIMIRSQVDLDIENEAEDHGTSEDEVLRQLKAAAAAEGFPSVFTVSSRQPQQYDFPHLLSSISVVAKGRRRLRESLDCPICFETFAASEDAQCCICNWCGNAVCGPCAAQLRGKLEEAPCPFCRRWTTLASVPKI